MGNEADLWDAEKRFWLEGPEFYRQGMTDETRMIFPGVGIIDGPQILEGLESAQRWAEVDMADGSAVVLGETAVLTYRAEARRRNAEHSYTAWCSSTYIRQGGRWKLLCHHQTPA